MAFRSLSTGFVIQFSFMKRFRSLLFVLAAFTFLPMAVAQEDIFREGNAAYLEDITENTHYVFLPEATPIFNEADLTRYLGTLRAGQRLELQAIGDEIIRVKGKAQQGKVSGWIQRASVQNLGEEFAQQVQAAYDRFVTVRDLIANKQVAIGMTQEEVALSLGKPTNTRSRVDTEGRSDVWEFIQYERLPRATGAFDDFGRPIYVYELIAVSTIAVVFQNGTATAVEETRDNVTRPRSVSIISAPVVF